MDCNQEPTAHAEPLVYLIRVFAPGKQFGDEYELSLVAQMLSPTKCEIKGLDKPLVPSRWRAVARALAALGLKSVIIVRKNADGTERAKEVRLKGKLNG